MVCYTTPKHNHSLIATELIAERSRLGQGLIASLVIGYDAAMYRIVSVLLVGVTLLLGGGLPAFANGEVIWEGTQESKLFSLTGPKQIKITTEGVFINGRFKPAWQLSKTDACLYGLSNFPDSGYVNTSKTWDAALRKFDFSDCQSIRLQAKHSYRFVTSNAARSASEPPITAEQMQAAYDAAQSGDFAKAKAIWDIAHRQGNDVATRNLGVMYANGDGVTKDLETAFQYYSQAADAGNLEAVFDVIDFLYNGKGTAQDLPAMAELVRKTHQQHPDDREANEWMGFIFREGIGVTKNTTQARLYFEKARSLGSDYAKKSLAEMEPDIGSSLTKNVTASTDNAFPLIDDDNICRLATYAPNGVFIWKKRSSAGFPAKPYVEEAKRRGLTCGVGTTDVQRQARHEAPATRLIFRSGTMEAHFSPGAATVELFAGFKWFLNIRENLSARKNQIRIGFAKTDKSTEECATIKPKFSAWVPASSLTKNGNTGIAVRMNALPPLSEDSPGEKLSVHIEDTQGAWACFGGLISSDGELAITRLYQVPWQNAPQIELANMSDHSIYLQACKDGYFARDAFSLTYVDEAKRRGLTCGVTQSVAKLPTSNIDSAERQGQALSMRLADELDTYTDFRKALFFRDGKTQQTIVAFRIIRTQDTVNTIGLAKVNDEICNTSGSFNPGTRQGRFQVTCSSGYSIDGDYVPLGEGNGSLGKGQDVFGNPIQFRIEEDRGDHSQIKSEFLALIDRLNEPAKRQAIPENSLVAKTSTDSQPPKIIIDDVKTNGMQGIVRGHAIDNVAIAELSIDGVTVGLEKDGSFEHSTFVPAGGITVEITAFDVAGLSSVVPVRLQRDITVASPAVTFDRLNPTSGKPARMNKKALALIVGVADYENTPAKAIFADSDALMFQDFASQKLGIPSTRIKSLVNEGAGEREVLLALKSWLSRLVTQEQTDIFVFFAGHGLASDDGREMYLLPYDGAPELLEETTISRQKLFDEIAAANPRSVTVFLDTWYSGTTRGPDMLIASRPIAIRAREQAVPEGFTVMTAAAGDQTAKPLEEAKHGMFSYFLMKEMEGDADANQDNRITAGELHTYVQQNVIQQSSGSQTPELQGDTDRVLVRFQ